MHKKYMVRLAAEGRKIRDATIEKLKGRSRRRDVPASCARRT